MTRLPRPVLPLRYNPMPWLLSSHDPVFTLRARRDLLGENLDLTELWTLPE